MVIYRLLFLYKDHQNKGCENGFTCSQTIYHIDSVHYNTSGIAFLRVICFVLSNLAIVLVVFSL